MKELGEARKILSIEISRSRQLRKVQFSQKSYLQKLIRMFHMLEAKEINIPFAQHFKLSHIQSPSDEESMREMKKISYSSAVGSLIYCVVYIRSDLAHAMSVASKFMANLEKDYWTAVKWILRYLKGTINMVLIYGGASLDVKSNILEFTDADYVVDIDKRRSFMGYVFKLWNSTISWKTNLQSVVALSTIEAKYIAATEAIKEVLWLKGIVVFCS